MGRIYSIGHGTRPLDEFLAIARDAGIRSLIDIRTAPRSRRHPQYGRDALVASLGAAGIGYWHLAGLGGWRRGRPDSPNVGLRTPGFRGYADHLESEEFARDYERLAELARGAATAYMCAETLWWRCHRRILSDRLVADGWEVTHLVARGKSEPHRLSALARVVDGVLVYDQVSEISDRASAGDRQGPRAGERTPFA